MLWALSAPRLLQQDEDYNFPPWTGVDQELCQSDVGWNHGHILGPTVRMGRRNIGTRHTSAEFGAEKTEEKATAVFPKAF